MSDAFEQAWALLKQAQEGEEEAGAMPYIPLDFTVPGHQFEQSVGALGEAMRNKEDNFQHIMPVNLNSAGNEHLREKMEERDIAHMRLEESGLDEYGLNPLDVGHHIAEMVMRRNPFLEEKVPPGGRISFHWGNISGGGHTVVDGKTGKPYTMNDMHTVYAQHQSGRWKPITMQSTPPWTPKDPTLFVPVGHHSPEQKQRFDEMNADHGMETPALDPDTFAPWQTTAKKVAVEDMPATVLGRVDPADVPPELQGMFKVPGRGKRAGQPIYTGGGTGRQWGHPEKGYAVRAGAVRDAVAEMDPEQAAEYWVGLLVGWLDLGMTMTDLTGYEATRLGLADSPGFEEAVERLRGTSAAKASDDPIELFWQLLKSVC